MILIVILQEFSVMIMINTLSNYVYFSFGTDNSTTLLEDISCSSSDLLVLLQCSVTDQYSASCSSSTQNDVIVHCCKCVHKYLK